MCFDLLASRNTFCQRRSSKSCHVQQNRLPSKHKHAHITDNYYHRRGLASEGIVTLGGRHAVCPPNRLYHILTARRISLGGEGNALYPVLSSLNV